MNTRSRKYSIAEIIGIALTRIIVPLWILTGAVFKLRETSPRTLPRESILNVADKLNVDLYLLLAILISLEFTAICIMVFLKRWARPMAIFMLLCFCLILINEIRGGATSCGCLGTFSPPPTAMLAIDGLMLLCVLVFKPRRYEGTLFARVPLFLTITGILFGIAVSFGVVIPAGRAPDSNIPKSDTNSAEKDSDTILNPSPQPLKGYWYVDDVENWIGKPWREVDLLTYMRAWPAMLDEGEHFVVFYSRTCDHCEDMFWDDLMEPREPPVVAIEVPADKNSLTAETAWEMPATNCKLMHLPIGTDWIMTTPLSLRIENGIITCAEEGDHKKCFGLD